VQPRRTRPLPLAAELLAPVSARVLSWARQRVWDDSGLEKLLNEAALVSWGWWDAVQHEASVSLSFLSFPFLLETWQMVAAGPWTCVCAAAGSINCFDV
jgi:hypothetical protein